MTPRFVLSFAVAGLLAGVAVSSPAIAGAKKAHKPEEKNLFQLIDADLKSFDKAVFPPQKTSAKAPKKHRKH